MMKTLSELKTLKKNHRQNDKMRAAYIEALDELFNALVADGHNVVELWDRSWDLVEYAKAVNFIDTKVTLNVSSKITARFGEETFTENVYDDAFALGIQANQIVINWDSEARNTAEAQNVINLCIGRWVIATL